LKINKFKKHDQGNHPQNDQFIEGKIGSGYMSTIEGQPHLEDFVENKKEEEAVFVKNKENTKSK
jgi:hypothetical protein